MIKASTSVPLQTVLILGLGIATIYVVILLILIHASTPTG